MVHRLFSTQFRFKITSKTKFPITNSNDETVLADETVYVCDPEWVYKLTFDIPHNISSAAITTVSKRKDYPEVTLLTTYTTPMNYYTIFNERTSYNSLNSTFIDT